MKVKINGITIKTDNITNITESDTDIIIEYFNGHHYMELDKDFITLEEIKAVIK